MRQLRQDVRGFWQFLHRQAGGDRAQADELAAAGSSAARERASRSRRCGPPRLPGVRRSRRSCASTSSPSTTTRPACAARSARTSAAPTRATPTTPAARPGLARLIADLGFGRKVFRDDLMSAVRFHRILRRGREYGPGLSPHDALAAGAAGRPASAACTSSASTRTSRRQFEFLQNAWMIEHRSSPV